MANLRAITNDQWIGLCAATRRQIKASGGHEACTTISRIARHQSFSDYGNQDAASAMPVDVLLELMVESSDVSLMRFLAQQVGCELIQLPQAKGFGPLQQAMGRTSKEFGEIFTAIGESLSDGKFDAQEKALCSKEINEAIYALLALRQSVEEGA